MPSIRKTLMRYPKREFEVALSFAGEDRAYVERVADKLRDIGLRVFYDKYESVTLWDKNLYDHLRVVYTDRAQFVVIFISRHYKAKVWTNTSERVRRHEPSKRGRSTFFLSDSTPHPCRACLILLDTLMRSILPRTALLNSYGPNCIQSNVKDSGRSALMLCTGS